MIEVHHLNNSRSQRVLWMLEELAVPYTVVRYERDARTMFAPPELKAVHPLGRSPVIRDGEAISSMLAIMGATETVRNWEELRQRREVRATANRLVNFDDANLRRSAQAAVAACARVERAMELLGDDIPEHLKYAGELRLAHRDASLDELGHHADPPMTKDAVAGRIRRLLAMADKRAAELGVPGTEASLPADLDV